MSERPEEEIKWLKLFLYHRDNAKNISKTLLDYITQLEAENGTLHVGMLELGQQNAELKAELEKAKADSKRLEKFFQHDIKLFTATRDAQGIIELVSPANREAFDERVKALEEEPHECDR